MRKLILAFWLLPLALLAGNNGPYPVGGGSSNGGNAATATNAADGTPLTNYASAWFYNSTNTYVVDYFNGSDSKPRGGRIFKTLSGIFRTIGSNNINVFAMPGPCLVTNLVFPFLIGDNFHLIGSGVSTVFMSTNHAVDFNWYILPGNNDSFESMTISNIQFQDDALGVVFPTNLFFSNLQWHNENGGDTFYYQNIGLGSGQIIDCDIYCGFDLCQGLNNFYLKNVNLYGNFTPTLVGGSQQYCHVFENCGNLILDNVNAYSLGGRNDAANGAFIFSAGLGGTYDLRTGCNFTIGGTNAASRYQLDDGSGVFTSTSKYSLTVTNLNNTGTNFPGGVLTGNGSGLTNLQVTTTATSSKLAAAVTIGTSPFTFSNATANVLECFFSGGTAYSVNKNGVAVYGSLAGDDYFLLQPTNKCTITYTVAPTLFTNQW